MSYTHAIRLQPALTIDRDTALSGLSLLRRRSRPWRATGRGVRKTEWSSSPGPRAVLAVVGSVLPAPAALGDPVGDPGVSSPPSPSRPGSTATCGPTSASSCPRARRQRWRSPSWRSGSAGYPTSPSWCGPTTSRAGERFVDALAAKLKELPPSLVAQVHYRVDAEKEFLDRHGALYADLKDLIAARDALRSQIAKANPLLIDLADESDSPPAVVDLEEAVGRIKAAYAKLDRFPDGYLAGENGHTLVMLLSSSGRRGQPRGRPAHLNAVDFKVKELNPKSFHPSIVIGYGGEIRGVIEAQEALVRDLALSSALTLSAVSLALILYYRTMRSVPLLVVPLSRRRAHLRALAGVIHYLNPNTAFLGSIIVGNGINAGIILLARYSRSGGRLGDRQGPSPLLARDWIATFAASAAGRGELRLAGRRRFRGFNQFAFIATGVRLFLLAASLGGVESLVILADLQFALQYDERRIAARGVSPGTVRVSIGLEDKRI